jgi:hypothetical protein
MNKLILTLITLIAFSEGLFAQAGTRIQPVTVSTNTGVVTFGTNVYSHIAITNNIAFSNMVSIGASGAFTNNGSSVLSNLMTHGTATFNGVIIVSNAVSRVATNTALTSITNNDFSVANTMFIAITNTTQGHIVFTGFSGGRDGQTLTIANHTLTNVFYIDQSASSTANNKILLLNGQTVLTNLGVGCTEFIYSTSGTNWLLKSFIP